MQLTEPRKNKPTVKYRPIQYLKPVIAHGCTKPNCQFCRIMVDIEIGDLKEIDNDSRRGFLHKLALGK